MSELVMIRSRMLALLLVTCLSVLSACATQVRRAAPPAPANEVQQQRQAREAWLAARDTWSFSGRAAISKAKRGGSGRIEWTQADARRYTVALSAPITRQSWRLIGDLHSESGRIEGLEGGPREGEDAEALLLEATGWEIPVDALGSWVRGLPAPIHPVDKIEYDTQGRPSLIRQLDWTIRYTGWQPATEGLPELPARIEATHDDASVRLAIDHWEFTPP